MDTRTKAALAVQKILAAAQELTEAEQDLRKNPPKKFPKKTGGILNRNFF